MIEDVETDGLIRLLSLVLPDVRRLPRLSSAVIVRTPTFELDRLNSFINIHVLYLTLIELDLGSLVKLRILR